MTNTHRWAGLRTVRWGRVGLFYGIAFGWVALIAVALYLIGQRDLSGVGASIATAILAFLYMPAPLVAALIVGRLDKDRPLLIRSTFTGFVRKLPRLLVVFFVLVPSVLLVMLGLSWVAGNLLEFSAAGRMLFTQADLVANTLTRVPAMDAAAVAKLTESIPSFPAMVGLAFGGAVIAGLTVNGLFAFGEEYGWRGWLAEELRPLGAFWANVVTGVLWGLWHAPIILMGFNYPGYATLGPVFMVALCIPFSFLLWRARQVTDSLLAPAILHGAFNGFAGIFGLILADPNPLIAAPVGLIGAASFAIVAALFWWATRRTAAQRSGVEAQAGLSVGH